MNENKTAITEMRQYAESWLDSGIEYSRGQIIEAMVNKARALEASQAEKDKGLVEELIEVLHTPCLFTDSWRVVERAKEILSRHEKGAK